MFALERPTIDDVLDKQALVKNEQKGKIMSLPSGDVFTLCRSCNTVKQNNVQNDLFSVELHFAKLKSKLKVTDDNITMELF